MVFLTIFPDVDFQELDEWVGNLDLGLFGLKILVVGLDLMRCSGTLQETMDGVL